jgi:2,6-dihydroxypseudooxynicotine hydrolase
MADLARPGGPADDARVRTAIAHWAPRFVANGIPLSDFEEVTASIRRWDDWCAAWSARGAIHEGLAGAAIAAGYRFSAAEHWTRAAVCFHFAKFVFVHDPVQMRAAHMNAVACRRAALPYLDPPGERVEIPHAGTLLYGILRKPEGLPRPPVVVMCMGLDSAKEEMHAYESTFLARGMATLAFDGPGQGEAEYELRIRGDYEVAVRSVIDFVERRQDLDAARIGLWGVSLGGYYAPRAAAFEKRIKACIALSGPFDWAAIWPQLNELTREAFRVRAKCETVEAAREYGASLTLKGVASKITCPLFIVAGKLDRLVPWQDAERLAREAGGPVEFLLIEDGNHVANNRAYRYRTQSADWLARELGVPAT